MRWSVETKGQLLRRIAIDYVRHGYYWYSMNTIPQRKDPYAVEGRVVRYYDISRCRMKRKRDRENGKGVVLLVRFGWILFFFATEGEHRFFDEDSPYDIRTSPLYFGGYSVGVKEDKPCVMVAPKRWKGVRRYANEIALHKKSRVEGFVQCVTPLTFPGIQQQKWKLIQEINRKRKTAGLAPIQWEDVR